MKYTRYLYWVQTGAGVHATLLILFLLVNLSLLQATAATQLAGPAAEDADYPTEPVDDEPPGGHAVSENDVADQPAFPAPSIDDPAEFGPPPWMDEQFSSLPLVPRATSPRELLVHIAPSEFERFVDNEPLDPNHETLIKILDRLPRFGRRDIQRLTADVFDWQTVAERPEQYRIELLPVEGIVTRVEKHHLTPRIAERFEFDHYYHVWMRLEDDRQVVIHTRSLPQAWQAHAEPLEEPATANGLFLYVAADDDAGQPLLALAAQRVKWFPQQINERLGVEQRHVALAQLSVDVGRLDDLQDGQPLTAHDAHAFYELLAATQRAERQGWPHAPQPFDLPRVFQQPRSHHGQIMNLQINARRITKVLVTDTDIRETFGIDHYFQIDGFVQLRGQTIQIARSQEEPKGPVYRNVFPVTVCSLHLPEPLEAIRNRLDRASDAETLNEQLNVEGVFYRLWAFRSQYVTQFDPRQMQISPMILAYQPAMVESPAIDAPVLGWLLGGSFLAALAVVWLAVWFVGRRDRLVDRQLSARRQAASPESLDELPETGSEPDFRNLP